MWEDTYPELSRSDRTKVANFARCYCNEAYGKELFEITIDDQYEFNRTAKFKCTGDEDVVIRLQGYINNDFCGKLIFD